MIFSARSEYATISVCLHFECIGEGYGELYLELRSVHFYVSASNSLDMCVQIFLCPTHIWQQLQNEPTGQPTAILTEGLSPSVVALAAGKKGSNFSKQAIQAG